MYGVFESNCMTESHAKSEASTMAVLDQRITRLTDYLRTESRDEMERAQLLGVSWKTLSQEIFSFSRY